MYSFTAGLPVNGMVKRSYQSYTPYNGTTVQYYFDDVDDIDDDDGDDGDETDEDGGKVDDDDRAYKNPRKLPSSECPRNEEQAAFMVIYSEIVCAHRPNCIDRLATFLLGFRFVLPPLFSVEPSQPRNNYTFLEPFPLQSDTINN